VRLQVLPAIDDEVDVDSLANDSVDYAVRLEKGLAIIAAAQPEMLLRMGAAIGMSRTIYCRSSGRS